MNKNSPLKPLMTLLMLLAGIFLTQCQHAVTNASMDADNSGPSSEQPAIEDDATRIAQLEADGNLPSLREAAESGDLAIVKHLVASGADVNEGECYDTSPLHMAAGSGHLEIVKYLVASGADINAGNLRNGETPLHVAVREGHLELAKYLVEQGGQDSDKHTLKALLHKAIEKGHLKLVKCLVERGVDVVNKEWCFAKTPLYIAAKFARVEIVKYLLEQDGAKEMIETENGRDLKLALEEALDR